MVKKLLIGLAIFVLLIFAIFYINSSSKKGESLGASIQNVQTQPSKFSYEGTDGKNALQLLREKADVVKQDKTGMVVAINEREADTKKHEFWAFHINGEFAKVGPLDYITKDGDQIEWKIEKY